MTSIEIANGKSIGEGRPCFVAAEVGINHNGDIKIAHRMIDAAADAGADAVKFQNYRTEDFLLDKSITYEYVSEGDRLVESQYEMFRRYELDPADLVELRQHCAERAVAFFSTPTSEAALDELVRAGAELLKNGSDYLGNLRLIQAMARTGLPTILSAGMATLAEIDDAVRAFRQAGGSELVLLHCTSLYPAPNEEVHLRKIPVLAAAFGCLVGFSDHTIGIEAALGARALGACFVEKHFTLDKSLPGPDHRFSADPGELRSLTEGLRGLEASLGQPAIGPTDAESASRDAFRLSCVAARDMPKGHRLSEADIAFARPGTGLPPKLVGLLVGLSLTHAVATGHVLGPGDAK
jgi:N,N'-diacetyllegionaminate synthase